MMASAHACPVACARAGDAAHTRQNTPNSTQRFTRHFFFGRRIVAKGCNPISTRRNDRRNSDKSCLVAESLALRSIRYLA